MVSWSLKRRIVYIVGTLSVVAIFLGWFIFVTSYQAPSCFDDIQNQKEEGIDCGGPCDELCADKIADPVILFSRSFKVADGVYNSVAYVENLNFDIGTPSIGYVFKLFDENNELIIEREGKTFISAGRISPIFEGGIITGEKIPTKTFFEFTNNPSWFRVEKRLESPFVIKNKTLVNTDTSPRINAVLENISPDELKEFEVVTTVFNALDNAIATSRTVIDYLPKRSSVDLVFTWPEPFTKELEVCAVPVDVMLLLDTSGSMNNDGDEPPQPLTDAKEAAALFVSRLTEIDRSGLVSFATNAKVEQGITPNHSMTENSINVLEILPEEEAGFTNMGDAIENSVSTLNLSPRRQSKSQDVEVRKVIVLLTDGEANAPEDPGGEEHALNKVSIAKNEGYSVYTIGLGEKVNSEFLTEIASINEESEEKQFYKASNSKDLSSIYGKISESICERGPAVIEIIPRISDKIIQN